MNMKVISKYKKIIIVILIIILLVVMFWDIVPLDNKNSHKNLDNGAELVAVEFIENMLNGDAEKCVSLMCDDLIIISGYDTKNLFINAFEKRLDELIESYKNKYGYRWNYSVSVIDSFEYTPEYYEYEGEGNLIKVVLEIEHTGGGLFKEKEGNDEFALVVEYVNQEWLVYSFFI